MTPSATNHFWAHMPSWIWPVIVVAILGFVV